MQSLRNSLGDPSLHLLGIALIVIYLAFGHGYGSSETSPEAPLPVCKSCNRHYLVGTTCICQKPGGIAHAVPGLDRR